MAATTTLLTNKLVKQLQKDFPALHFAPGDIFYWSSSTQTIHYSDINSPDDIYCLFHELAHGLLGHTLYKRDIELLRLETEAWRHATHIAATYSYKISESYAQDALDSYSHWLFERSHCPACGHTGMQQTKNTYQCINCRCLWRVNDAKICALRRVKLQA